MVNDLRSMIARAHLSQRPSLWGRSLGSIPKMTLGMELSLGLDPKMTLGMELSLGLGPKMTLGMGLSLG